MSVAKDEPTYVCESRSESENDDTDSECEDEATKINIPIVKDDERCMKTRHVLGILGFLGFANVYAMRANLSVAIVAMVNHTAIPSSSDNSNNTFDHCPLPEVTNTTNTINDGPFAWDEATQGLVLGAFFYGYILTQVPGGRLAEMYGSKIIFGVGVFMTAIFTLLSPLAAVWNFNLFVLVRILEGMSEGVTFPAMHAMLARWVPPLERSRFGAYVYAGCTFGTVVSFPLSGWLCSLTFMGGWPLAFYIFGILGLVWVIFWGFLVFDSPTSHPRISTKELAYLKATIGLQDDIGKGSVPWLSMIKCLPLWAILITQCGQGWLFYTLLTELPTYMSELLHFNIQQNAVLTAVPHLASWWYGIANSIFADWLLYKGYLSLATSNKLFNSIASVVPALGLLVTAWLGCDWFTIQIVLAVSYAFSGASYAGCSMNHISLSPKYAGTMYGITNGISNICGFLAPYVVGLLIQGNETVGQWRLVFYLAAGISMGTNLFYVAFASASEQAWARSKRENIIN